MAKHAAHADNGKSYKNINKENSAVYTGKTFRRREVESLKRSESEHYSTDQSEKTLHSSDSELYLRRYSKNADFARGEMPVRYNRFNREKLPEYNFEHTSASGTLDSKEIRDFAEEVFNNEENGKPRGKGIIIAVAVICVIAAFCIGFKIYYDGTKGNGDTSGSPSAAEVDNMANIPHGENAELAVVTVSGKTIKYNSKKVVNAKELEDIIADLKNPTLSLININADIDTYNSVAKVLNKHGGNYELMDENNTLPSIKN